MADTEDQPAISEDTVEMIEGQVKKGKARKFFLIYKGATIKTLVVFKKGPFGPKIMEAKKNGFKGEVAYGVVTGSGKNLFFQLPGNGEVAAAMKVDGFSDKPPTKKSKLRAFLADNGLNFKPSIHVLTNPAAAPNPDAESETPVPPPPPGSEVEDDEGGTTTASEGQADSSEEPSSQYPRTNEYEELYRGLLSTLPSDLQRLRLVNEVTASKIQKIVDAGGVHAANGDFKVAYKYLDQASQALAKALGTGRSEQAAGTIPEGIVAMRKATLSRAQTRWDAALTVARQRLKPVQDEVQEEFPNMAQGLKNILDSYEKDLLDEILAGQAKSNEDELTVAVSKTLEKVQSLRTEANSDDVLNYLDECGIPVMAAFAEAFDDVEELLRS